MIKNDDDTKPKRRIALFGGTFDPVHQGHLKIAEWALKELKLDRVLFIPNFIHPFRKRANITLPKHRVEMLKLALQDSPQFDFDAVEIERKGVSFTIDTLRYFHTKLSNAQFFLLIGADILHDFARWKESEKILDLAQLVVYHRHEKPENSNGVNENFIYIENPHIDISSTQIRHRILQTKSCAGLLPAKVEQYIRENGVYQTPLKSVENNFKK